MALTIPTSNTKRVKQSMVYYLVIRECRLVTHYKSIIATISFGIRRVFRPEIRIVLTLCILTDFSIHIYTISMGAAHNVL